IVRGLALPGGGVLSDRQATLLYLPGSVARMVSVTVVLAALIIVQAASSDGLWWCGDFHLTTSTSCIDCFTLGSWVFPTHVPVTKACPAMLSCFFVAFSVLLTTAAGLARDVDPFKDWPQSYLNGTVRDPDGKPVNGARVHLNNADGPHGMLGGNWSFT